MKKVESLLLVDDDEIYKFLTKKVIEETSMVSEIKFFSNGLEAINFLQEQQNNSKSLPDIILLDLSMPVLDGWGFLDEFIKLKPKISKKITIYIVSSSINPQEINRAKTISIVSDFIIKPITKDKFIAMLKTL